MRIAIPLVGGRLTEHFGHCQELVIVDVDPDEKRVLSATQHVPPPHEPGILPRWLGDQGVDMVIAGGMGGKAQAIFAGFGVRVVVGAPAQTPQALVESCLDGTLGLGPNACDHGHGGGSHGRTGCGHAAGPRIGGPGA